MIGLGAIIFGALIAGAIIEVASNPIRALFFGLDRA